MRLAKRLNSSVIDLSVKPISSPDFPDDPLPESFIENILAKRLEKKKRAEVEKQEKQKRKEQKKAQKEKRTQASETATQAAAESDTDSDSDSDSDSDLNPENHSEDEYSDGVESNDREEMPVAPAEFKEGMTLDEEIIPNAHAVKRRRSAATESEHLITLDKPEDCKFITATISPPVEGFTLSKLLKVAATDSVPEEWFGGWKLESVAENCCMYSFFHITPKNKAERRAWPKTRPTDRSAALLLLGYRFTYKE